MLRRAALLASVLLLVSSTVAIGHSGVRATSPKKGSVVRVLPKKVTITFRDRLLRVTRARVIDARGRNHVVWARLDRRNAAKVVIRTRRPVAGRYRVLWKVQAEDGHTETGSFRFRARRSR